MTSAGKNKRERDRRDRSRRQQARISAGAIRDRWQAQAGTSGNRSKRRQAGTESRQERANAGRNKREEEQASASKDKRRCNQRQVAGRRHSMPYKKSASADRRGRGTLQRKVGKRLERRRGSGTCPVIE